MSDATDCGRQAERTVLAHGRTALAATVVAMLVVREAAPGVERRAVAVAVAVAIAVAVGASIRRQRALRAGRTAADRGAVLAVAASVVALQLVAVVIVV